MSYLWITINKKAANHFRKVVRVEQPFCFYMSLLLKTDMQEAIERNGNNGLKQTPNIFSVIRIQYGDVPLWQTIPMRTIQRKCRRNFIQCLKIGNNRKFRNDQFSVNSLQVITYYSLVPFTFLIY